MSFKKEQRLGIILAALGIVVAIIGAVLIAAIFPSLEKLPADHQRTINFEGTYSVLDPATRQLVEFPVNVARVQQAAGTVDGALLIDEKISATNSATGEELPRFGSNSQLAVDRATRQHVPGYGDASREGYFGPPSHLEEEKSFSLWNPAAGKPLEAKYLGTEEFRGLEVFTFKTEEYDIPIDPDPQTHLERRLDIVIELKVEPVSGTTVGQKSLTTYNLVLPVVGRVPAFVSEIEFAESTIAEMLDTASSARTQLLWLMLFLPWIVIGLGIVLIIAGATVIVRRTVQASKGGI